MLAEFNNYISEKRLFEKKDRILLAVSGGIDSMVMTHLFLIAGYKIGLAHCNFGLRSEESDKDEDMVRVYAEKHNIPFFSKKFDTKLFAAKKHISVQMAARELRYNWFEEIRNQNNFDYISVAHNLNDNVETLLINLTRGTGITGLTGIKPSHNRIIRPMLFATRQVITEYCTKNGITYREDRSNAETKYIRNKIRHLVIPLLKDINPSIETTLNETVERLSEIDEIVADHIKEIMGRISGQRGSDTVFNASLLKPLLGNKSIIYELFKTFGVSAQLSKDLYDIINGKTGKHIYTNTHRILKNRNEIIVTPLMVMDEPYFVINSINDIINVPSIKSAHFVIMSNDFIIPSDKCVACLDADKLIFPLIIRSWKAGDYFCPLGMKKKKKLSDYFIDNKYSIPEKEKALIIESSGEIVCILGERIDDRFRTSRDTKKVLLIKVNGKC